MSETIIKLDLHSQADTLELRPWVTPWMLRQAREDGRLGIYRMGRRVFISLSELDALFTREQREQQ